MPLPRAIARMNRRVTNHLLGGLALRLPGFGVVVHTGRRSLRQYRTPVNVFRRDDRYIIALTYGSNADWVRNVLAHGGCTLETQGRTLHLSRPRLFHDESRRPVPAPVRFGLGLVNVNDFLELTVDNEGSTRDMEAAIDLRDYTVRRRVRAMPTPIATGPIHHLRLTVSDVERSRAFYTEVVGFQFVMDLPSGVFLSNGAVGLGLGPSPDPSRAPANDRFDEARVGLDHLSFSVATRDELERARQLLDERGMPHGEITDLGDAFGLYILAFRDPDNIQLELTAAYG